MRDDDKKWKRCPLRECKRKRECCFVTAGCAVDNLKKKIKAKIKKKKLVEKKKVDMTDDWMNPVSQIKWTYEPPKNEMQYLIIREKKEICFGNPGYITTWETWSTHKTAKERDKYIEELREQHPMWRLAKRDSNPFLESFSIRRNNW